MSWSPRAHWLMRWGGAVGLIGAGIGIAADNRPIAQLFLATFFILLILATVPAVGGRPRLRSVLGWLGAAAAFLSLVFQIV